MSLLTSGKCVVLHLVWDLPPGVDETVAKARMCELVNVAVGVSLAGRIVEIQRMPGAEYTRIQLDRVQRQDAGPRII